MHAPSRTLGIDFGTSNSAAGVLVDGKPHLVTVEAGLVTLPTSVFFDFTSQTTIFGHAANQALIAGEDGRFMRSLKSILGTSLMHEPRRMIGETWTFVDIIARFLAHVKARAEAEIGRTFDYALSGRPVHFHSSDAGRDAQAVKDLRACYQRAGFEDVRFLYEPEAAARARGAAKGLSLIVDIGGGTSDYSLFRPGADGIEILASHGVRLGGTNFDREISVERVMPLFGRGTMIRNEMGPGALPAPAKIFQDLATWQMIPFLYAPDVRRDVALMQKLAVEPARFARLAEVLEHRLGHDVAFAVEAAKIAANGGVEAMIDLAVVEPKLAAVLTAADLDTILARHKAEIAEAASVTLGMAGVSGTDVAEVIFVGGSSLMGIVEDGLASVCPNAGMHRADAFTAVVDGLAIASGDTW